MIITKFHDGYYIDYVELGLILFLSLVVLLVVGVLYVAALHFWHMQEIGCVDIDGFKGEVTRDYYIVDTWVCPYTK